MKKYIATLFVLFLGTSVMGSSNSDPAVKSGCPEPKTCTLWESEVCYREQGEYIGEDVCLECSCPDGGGETKILMDEKSGLSLTTLCCKGLDEYDSEAKAYRPSTNCGCSESETFHIYNGESYCCNDAGYGFKNFEIVGFIPEVCGCPAEETLVSVGTEVICCGKNGYGRTSGNPQGRLMRDVCGCPKHNNEDSVFRNGVCCTKDYQGYDEERDGFYIDKRCCPQKENATVEMIGTECCLNGKSYDETTGDYTKESYECGCPEERVHPKLFDFWLTPNPYVTANLPDEEELTLSTQLCCYDTIHQWHDINICCKEVPTCTENEGVVIPQTDGSCVCGCLMDEDCNTFSINPFSKKRKCYKQKCVNEREGCFEIDGITVEYDSIMTTKTSEAVIRSYIDRIKGELKLNPDDKFIIKFKQMECKYGGFVSLGNTNVININSIHCCWLPNGSLSCEGIIFHENKHRINALKQIKWYSEFKTQLARAYQDILNEIDAHAEGDMREIKNYYETCYPEEEWNHYGVWVGGGVRDVCAEDAEGEACQTCRELYRRMPAYLRDYLNKERAEKYYSNKEAFDPSSCDGERLAFERAYLNSVLCRTAYIEGQAKRNSEEYEFCSFFGDSDNEYYQDLKDAIDACQIKFDENETSVLTDLPALIAELYQQNGILCMTPEEFASNKNMNLGLTKLSDCDIMYSILASNSDVSDWKEIAQACRNEKSCVKGEEITFTSN